MPLQGRLFGLLNRHSQNSRLTRPSLGLAKAMVFMPQRVLCVFHHLDVPDDNLAVVHSRRACCFDWPAIDKYVPDDRRIGFLFASVNHTFQQLLCSQQAPRAARPSFFHSVSVTLVPFIDDLALLPRAAPIGPPREMG